MTELGVCSDEQGCRCGQCSRSLPVSKEKARPPPELQDVFRVNDHLAGPVRARPNVQGGYIGLQEPAREVQGEAPLP